MGTTFLDIQIRDAFSVHPHLRGDHAAAVNKANKKAGSSPPAWGPHGLSEDQDHLRRFIPTCVGTTVRFTKTGKAVTVHPHLRGDHSGYLGYIVHALGSSPPAWGPPDPVYATAANRRFIPTCVGTTIVCRLQRMHKTVHPHLRGDHLTARLTSIGPGGSSPPAWGPHN